MGRATRRCLSILNSGATGGRGGGGGVGEEEGGGGCGGGPIWSVAPLGM